MICLVLIFLSWCSHLYFAPLNFFSYKTHAPSWSFHSHSIIWSYLQQGLSLKLEWVCFPDSVPWRRPGNRWIWIKSFTSLNSTTVGVLAAFYMKISLCPSKNAYILSIYHISIYLPPSGLEVNEIAEFNYSTV